MASLNQQLFEKKLSSTRDIFNRIKVAIDTAQKLIVENEGTLTTLTISVVCPSNRRWLVCTASIGDSNAYVYSQRQGHENVFELTQGSRDLNNERDMRSPGGALGMALGEQADLSNLTYSLMEIDQGDFVFLTTDGLSDNYDPCVSGAAVSTKTPLLARKSTTSTTQEPLMLMTAYQRHLCSLDHMRQAITDNRGENELNAYDLCDRLIQHVVRLTNEQRSTIEKGIREHKDVEGNERKEFEQKMRDIIIKIPGKMDHATIVVYKVR